LTKFVHTADIHLDSPLLGLVRYEGAPVEYLRSTTRRALSNLVELCLTEKVDFLLISGDLYDGNWRDYNTGLFLSAQFARLREANIPVFIIRGNHDAQSIITHNLHFPDNVTELSTEGPETHFLNELGVAIHGQGFGTRAVTDNISLAYPAPIPGLLNIGLLHTSAEGRAGHEPYAPCRVDQLTEKGYDYWALGHVHKREVLAENPWVVFPGNTQGRHINEEGRKGCTVVTADPGKINTVAERELDVLRWQRITLDACDAATTNDLLDEAWQATQMAQDANPNKFLALRFVITGATAIDRRLRTDHDYWVNNLRAVATDVSGGNVWVERVLVQTRPRVRLKEITEHHHPIAFLLDFIEQIPDNKQYVLQLLEELDDLQEVLAKLPNQPNLQEPEVYQALLADAAGFLTTRLYEAGGDTTDEV
jgi:exonuclease SbcD